MPTPKLFRSSSARSNVSSSSVAAAAPAKDKGITQKTTRTSEDDSALGSSSSLREVWVAANQESPREHVTGGLLSGLGGSITNGYLPFSADFGWEVNVQKNLAPPPGQQIVVTKASMDTPEIADAILKGVNTFMEAVPPLLKSLDEVAKVHPFVSGAGNFLQPTRDA
jgi:hypothetical protein